MEGLGPILGLSASEAGEILGVQARWVDRMVCDGRLREAVKHARRGLDRTDVETIALERTIGYWVGTREAAQMLGISVSRVKQLCAEQRLSFRRHGREHRFRRAQIEVIANARH